MMCFKHDRFYRVGQCPLCIEDEKVIKELEWENSLIDLTLWEGKGKS